MKRKSRRSEQVGSVIRKALGDILSQEISDPTMGIVSVTDVDLASDLRTARVYFTILGGKKDLEKQINTIRGLEKYLRQKLAERVVLRYLPELRLFFDETPRQAQKIDRILIEIQKEREEREESSE